MCLTTVGGATSQEVDNVKSPGGRESQTHVGWALELVYQTWFLSVWEHSSIATCEWKLSLLISFCPTSHFCENVLEFTKKYFLTFDSKGIMPQGNLQSTRLSKRTSCVVSPPWGMNYHIVNNNLVYKWDKKCTQNF